MQKAFDVLGDERKREIYDQGGEEAVEEGGGGGGPADIFDVLGGRGRRGGSQSRVKKGENMVHPLKVTLEQIFKGSARTLRLTRKVIDKEKGVEQCSACGGRGVKIQTIRMGPMIQQVQKTCDTCGGNGMMYRQLKVQETLEVHVPKGAPDGHKVCACKDTWQTSLPAVSAHSLSRCVTCDKHRSAFRRRPTRSPTARRVMSSSSYRSSLIRSIRERAMTSSLSGRSP